MKLTRVIALIALIALTAVTHAVPAASTVTPAGIITAARAQIGVTTRYDASYQTLTYPGGDVAITGGVCTDVVIRALRAQNLDLQALVHVDMAKHFASYPKLWGLARPDRNIDHRRVPNLQRYFSRMGWALKLPTHPKHRPVDEFRPGDLVTWMLPGNLPHIGIVSDQRTLFAGRYKVLHNVGLGTQEDDALELWPQTGHYRIVR
jgi:uncharacterized protein